MVIQSLSAKADHWLSKNDRLLLPQFCCKCHVAIRSVHGWCGLQNLLRNQHPCAFLLKHTISFQDDRPDWWNDESSTLKISTKSIQGVVDLGKSRWNLDLGGSHGRVEYRSYALCNDWKQRAMSTVVKKIQISSNRRWQWKGGIMTSQVNVSSMYLSMKQFQLQCFSFLRKEWSPLQTRQIDQRITCSKRVCQNKS